MDLLENTTSAPPLVEDEMPSEDTTQDQVEEDRTEELTDKEAAEITGGPDSRVDFRG